MATAKKLTKRHYAKAKELSSKGASRGTIAKALRMSVPTLYRHIDKDDKLKEALAEGDIEDVQEVSNVLRERALAGSAQHADRYLQLRHGIYLGGAKPQGFDRRGGTVIVVVPFETGQNKWNTLTNEERQQELGELIEHEPQEQEEMYTDDVQHNIY